MTIEAVARMDAIFAVEREINGLSPVERQAACHTRSRPLVEALHAWLRQNRPKLSAKATMAKAMDYMLKRWPAFTRFLNDGRICLSTDGVEKPRSSSCREFSRLFRPGGNHPLVGLLDAGNVPGLPFAEFLDPVVPTRTGLAVGAGSARLEPTFRIFIAVNVGRA